MPKLIEELSGRQCITGLWVHVLRLNVTHDVWWTHYEDEIMRKYYFIRFFGVKKRHFFHCTRSVFKCWLLIHHRGQMYVGPPRFNLVWTYSKSQSTALLSPEGSNILEMKSSLHKIKLLLNWFQTQCCKQISVYSLRLDVCSFSDTPRLLARWGGLQTAAIRQKERLEFGK